MAVFCVSCDPPPPPPQFAILLTLVIIIEIAAAIAGYIFRGKVRSTFQCSGAAQIGAMLKFGLLCSVYHVAHRYRPGQPDRYGFQLQERNRWFQKDCGQNAGGRKCANATLTDLSAVWNHSCWRCSAAEVLWHEQLCWLEKLRRWWKLRPQLVLHRRHRRLREERDAERECGVSEGT